MTVDYRPARFPHLSIRASYGLFFGAPLIKGFAITLAIGVGVSMFSAIVTTQQLLQVIAGLRPARRLAFYGVQAPPRAA